MISSSVNFFWYAASGLSVGWAWFFSEIWANSSKLVPPYLWPYSMPIWANVPGMVAVPMRPSIGATAPKRPDGVHSLPALFACPPAAEDPGAGELLHSDGETEVAFARLHRHDRGAQRGGARGARVRHVVH